MHAVNSFLLFVRCVLLLSILVVSRLIAPRLIDNALSESDYTLEADDVPTPTEQFDGFAAQPPQRDFAAVVHRLR